MDRMELDLYKQLLVAKRNELLPDKLTTLFNAGRAEGRPGDFSDRANEEARMAFEAHLRQSKSRLLRAIEEALIRIEHNTFGVCQTCRRPIAEARLKAVPWTRPGKVCPHVETAVPMARCDSRQTIEPEPSIPFASLFIPATTARAANSTHHH